MRRRRQDPMAGAGREFHAEDAEDAEDAGAEDAEDAEISPRALRVSA